MNKKYLIVMLLFLITLLLTGYIYCEYKEKEFNKNNDITIKETKKENDISKEKEEEKVAEKIVLKGEENVQRKRHRFIRNTGCLHD